MSTASAPAAHADPRRLIMLMGTARCGSTWLAKILDTYPGVLYLHEPLTKLHYPPADALLDRIRKGGRIGPEERNALLAHLAREHHTCCRLPFFPKSFHPLPPEILQIAWMGGSTCAWGRSLFSRLAGPPPGRPFDLLVKDVDWHLNSEPIVASLRPDRMLLLIRHPCGVVCSRLNGLSMGVIPAHDLDTWLSRHLRQAEEAGFAESRIRAMNRWSFYALDWLVQNIAYQNIARTWPGSRTVVFESLCHAPMAMARELFSWLGWEQGPATNRFIAACRGRGREGMLRWASDHRRYYGIRRNPHMAAESWRLLLEPQQIADIMAVARAFPSMHWWEGGGASAP